MLVRFPTGARGLTGSGTQPAFHSTNNMALVLDVKEPDHEAGHSHTSRAEVKNGCSYTSTPPHAFMTCIGALPFSQ